MKVMDALDCLGISVVQNVDGIWLHQKQYILSMLQKFGLIDAKPASTPECQAHERKWSYISDWMTNHCTGEAHLSAVKIILRYLEISHYDTRGVHDTSLRY